MTESSKTIPHNIEAEQALLGAILMNNDAMLRVGAFLEVKHFHEPFHRKIYEVIGEFIGHGKRANPVTLKNFLPAQERVGDMTVAQYLARLAAEAVTVINAEDYGHAILDCWQRRCMILAAEDLINKAYDARINYSPAKIRDELLDQIDEIVLDSGASNTNEQFGSVYLNSLNDAYARKKSVGVPIVFSEIKEVLSEESFEAGNLYGLLGSSGEGKTSITLQIIRHAVEHDHPVLFMSYDQTEEQCLRQMLAQTKSISARSQRNGSISQSDFEEAVALTEWLRRKSFRIVECVDQTASQLIRISEGFVKTMRKRGRNKTPIIIIDHIMRIAVDDKNARDEGARARASTSPLKGHAKSSQSAVILLNQRNGQGAARDNPRPTKRDLYGGEAATYDYDSIIYVYRYKKWRQEKIDNASTSSDYSRIERVFGPETEEDLVEIGSLKVRFGSPYERRKMKFNAPFTRYESLIVPELIENPMRLSGRLF